MNESSHFTQTGRARRLIATVVIGSAAAAVTAGVALNDHPPAQAGGERATAGTQTAGPTRRVEWRDPWQHPAPRDPSVPAATTALGGAADRASSEPAPTF